MILNISNNTDIVQFYTPWLIKRFDEGFFSIETQKTNNVYQLTPNNFEIIVFQTKNPKPIIPYIKALQNKGFKFFFIITITPYDNQIEHNIDKSDILNSIKQLSQLIGADHIIWKYAPVILNNELTANYHYKYYDKLASKLHKYIRSSVIEFVKPFEHPIHAQLYSSFISSNKKNEMLKKFNEIAKKYNLSIYSKACTNGMDMTNLMSTIISQELNINKFNFEILDMGLPNTCPGDCEYCFCGGNKKYKNNKNNPNSPLFIGDVNKKKKHINRKVKSILISE